MLDACLAHGQHAFGVVGKSDQSDGFYFLKHTFPTGMTRAEVFDAMSNAAQSDTGIYDAVIREKPIPLPELPALKTEGFYFEDWSPETTLAEVSEKMRLFDRHFASLKATSKAFIVEQYFYPGTDIVSRSYVRTVNETKQIYNSSITVIVQPATDKKPEQRKPMLDIWLADPRRRVREKVDFLATQAERDANPRVLSSFSGLYFDTTVSQSHATAADHPGVKKILDFIFNILADGKQTHYDYILGWLAAGLQNLTKLGVILVFVGAAGAGKSLLFSECEENHPIFQTFYGGVEGYYQVGQGIEDLVTRFNIMSSCKFFACAEELKSGATAPSHATVAPSHATAPPSHASHATAAPSHATAATSHAKSGAAQSNMDKLKHLAGARYVTFEAKHADATPQLDRRNFVCLTNHEDALGADGFTGDVSRKFAVFEPSDKYSKAKRDADPALNSEAFDYFSSVDAAQADPETQEAFYWYLKTLPLDNWRAYDYPITPILKRYKADANAIPSWFAELTSGNAAYGCIEFEVGKFVSSLDLYSNFAAWAKIYAPVNKDTFKQFTNQLAKFAESRSDVLTAANHSGKIKGYKLLRAFRLDGAVVLPGTMQRTLDTFMAAPNAAPQPAAAPAAAGPANPHTAQFARDL